MTAHSPAPTDSVSRRLSPSLVSSIGIAILLAFSWSASAANKSGVTPNTISLPSGPGSIEGLGEAFQPTLNTGTAKYGLPLELPPGTAGHAPSLSLAYEGGSGNGPLGFGWSLPISYIQRQCDKGIPRYVDRANNRDDDLDGEVDEPDEIDVFINQMKEELVPQASGYYFCENEGAFIRYEKRDDYWIGTLPTGTRLEFGLSEQARITDQATGRVYRWCLERTTDTHGNTIVYSYASFPGDENLNQIYCSGVAYGPGAPPWENFHFVRFIYEDRSDWFEDGRPGFILRTGKRLNEIVIGTQGPELAGHLAGDFNQDGTADFLNRKYALTYLDYAPPESHWSLLHQVTLVGADGVSTLPPAVFGYAVCHPPETISAGGQWLGGVNEPPVVMDNELVELVDLNGDALPDILKTERFGGGHVGYLNAGETNTPDGPAIQWQAPQEVDSEDGLARNVNLESQGDIAHLADMDGDGLADLAYRSALGDVFYFLNRANLGWGPRQFMSVQDFSPPSPFGNPNAKTADIDFDKRMDIIESIATGSGADYRIWFNRGQQRFSRSQMVPQAFGFPLSLNGVQIADFNGDRVPDMVRLRPNTIVVTAGLGHGHFAAPVTVPLPDFTLNDQQISKAKLKDITGDGLVDLALERAVPGQFWYWINRGNYTLTLRRIITHMPVGLGPNPVIRWADLNGNGTKDLIYADSTSVPRILTVDVGRLMGCKQRPHTLTRIENGIGQVTHIHYEPSTKFALEDAAAGHPWPDVMPFPVSVVARVVTEDSLGNAYVTKYQYHDGYYDPEEKEFRGFARAEQIEVGDETAPTLVTRSYFDTGRDFEPMKGKLLKQTAGLEDGRLFWESTTTWLTPPKVLRTGINGQEVRYVHPTAGSRRVIEFGVGTERLLESESAFDDYGNQTLDAEYGIVAEGDRSAFDDERITTTEYAINTEDWLLRLPSRTQIMDEHGQVISRSEQYYDDETFSGNNLGQVIRGNLTLKREWIDPDLAGSFVNSSRAKYDSFGNPILFLEPLASAPGGEPDSSGGHFQEVQYDELFRTHSERETIHVGGGKPPLIARARYDHGFGTIAESWNMDGHWSTYGHDAFGRLVTIIEPGDTVAYPTAEFRYVMAVPFGASGVVNYVETRSLDRQPSQGQAEKADHYFISRQYTDGLGRALLSKAEAEPDPATGARRVVVEGAVLFNARESVRATLNAYFSTLSGERLESLLDFEDVRSPGWTGIFHAEGKLRELDLASAHATELVYDALGRTTESVKQDGARSRTVYEPFVQRAFDESDTDESSSHFNTPTVYYSDGLGRQIRTDEVVRLNDDGTPSPQLHAWTTTFEYDLNDQLRRITDSQGNVKTMEYDGLARMTFMNDPDRGVIRRRYDDGGNLIELTDAKGQVITFTYDGVNRRLTEDYHDETEAFSHGYAFDPSQPISQSNRPDVAMFYDAPQPDLDMGDGTRQTASNTKGVLAYVWDLSGEEHMSYDERGRVSWIVKRTVDPTTHGSLNKGIDPAQLVSYRTEFMHDRMSRLSRVTYPDGDEAQYEYNERSRLRQISGDVAGPVFTVPEYLPSGQFVRIRYGNGVEAAYAYDRRLRLQSLLTRPASLDSEYIHFEYTLDRVSNFLAIEDRRPDAVVPAADPRRNTQSFEYDDLYRLTQIRYSFGLPGQIPSNDGEINYRYDRIGNMIAKTSNIEHVENGLSVTDLGTMSYGGAAGASARIGRDQDSPGPHALSDIRNPTSGIRQYSYDTNGNMAEIDGLVCTWDFKDRLVAVENDQMRAEYVYDYRDQRVVKRVTPKPGPQQEGQRTRDNAPRTVLYIGKHFEVREGNQPTKFVRNSELRVARVTGSLSSTERIQRIPVREGWNLVSLAVDTSSSAILRAPVGEAFRWDSGTDSFPAVGPAESLAAGTVLWLKASADATLGVRGAYREPGDVPVTVKRSFYPGAGLYSVRPEKILPPDVPAWRYDAEHQAWQVRLTPEIGAAAGSLPDVLSPGEVLFVGGDQAVEIQPLDSKLTIRYYHLDHLGSSNVITDAQGEVTAETAFYPFGDCRHRHEPRDVRGEYLFTQKERDRESGLNYFGARHMSGVLGRFLCPDPRYVEGNEHADAIAAAPQMLNLYAYAGNSPVQYTDPTGLDKLSVRGFLETALEVQSVLIGTHPAYEKAVSIALNNPIDKPATEAIDGVLGTVHSGLTKLEKAYDDHVGPVNNPVTQVKSMVPKSRAEAAWQLLMAVTTGGAAKAGQARQAAAQKLKQELARPVTVYKPLSTVKVHTKVASQTALSKTHHASPPCLADTMPAWRGQRMSQQTNPRYMSERSRAIREYMAETGLEPVRTARYGTQRGQPIETMAEWGRRNMKRVLNVWKEADEVFGAMNIENPFRR